MSRILQIIKYGWKHAGTVGHKNRIATFLDILYCYKKYKMWSNQYIAEKFFEKSKCERYKIGKEYYVKGIKRDEWQKDFIKNRKFLCKYTARKYEVGSRRRIKRMKAYQKRYGIGNNLAVEFNVELSRQHYLDGTIKIGNNVLLAKNTFIDYSGDVIIKDNVQLTNGVIIESHQHAFHSDYKQPREIITKTNLKIEEGAVIGSRAIILSSCHYIGKHARIGAGAVVTKDIPDYAIAVGSPAKVIRIMASDDTDNNY